MAVQVINDPSRSPGYALSALATIFQQRAAADQERQKQALDAFLTQTRGMTPYQASQYATPDIKQRLPQLANTQPSPDDMLHQRQTQEQLNLLNADPSTLSPDDFASRELARSGKAPSEWTMLPRIMQFAESLPDGPAKTALLTRAKVMVDPNVEARSEMQRQIEKMREDAHGDRQKLSDDLDRWKTQLLEEGRNQRHGQDVQVKVDIAGMQDKTKRDIASITDPVTRHTLAVGIADGVLRAPQSYFSLPKKKQDLFVELTHRAPVHLSSAENDSINGATTGLNLLTDAEKLVGKWSKRGVPIIGPFLGRWNAATKKFGSAPDNPRVPPALQHEYKQDVAQLQEWLTMFPIQEARAVVGGRVAHQIIERVASVAPSGHFDADFFAGAIGGARQRLQARYQELDSKQWGGAPPDLAQIEGGIYQEGPTTASPASAAPLPPGVPPPPPGFTFKKKTP